MIAGISRRLPQCHLPFVVTRRFSSGAAMSEIKFNSRHFRSGDERPTVDPDRLTFYNMRYCPFATRTMLVMLKKGIDFDVININLADRPDWFFAINPSGKVPVLQHGDFIGRESSLLNSYLDEKFPDVKLGPDSPEQKVLDANLLDEVDRKITKPFYAALNTRGSAESVSELTANLFWLDGILTRDGRGPFFAVGRAKVDGPGLIDYNLFPWTAGIRILPAMGFAKISMDKYPNLSKWIDLMDADSAVKTYGIPMDIWVDYFSDHLAGKVDRYDRLLEA